MILPEEGSPIECVYCARCGKVDEMLVERGIEMVILTMVSGLTKI
jgi:hypothetical protein